MLATVLLTSLLLLLLSTELLPLFVGTKDPVPPAECAGVVAVEVVVMKIMKSSTCTCTMCKVLMMTFIVEHILRIL